MIQQAHYCPGKVNLLLQVLNQRSDGYHNIKTIFQTIEIGDILEASYSDQIKEITLEGAGHITESLEQNLIIKAARALKEKYNSSKGIHFKLQKKLPMGAGLGGGSSNCAAALILCNEMWNLNLSSQDLINIGQHLGADVPFFIRGGTALGEGIGTKLTTLPPPPSCYVLIATPNSFVSTKEAYQHLPKKRIPLNPIFLEKYNDLSKKKDISGLLQLLTQCHNDFHSSTLKRYPEIFSLFQTIQSFKPLSTLLSGSGASLFAIFKDVNIGQKCLKSIQPNCRFSALTTWRN